MRRFLWCLLLIVFAGSTRAASVQEPPEAPRLQNALTDAHLYPEADVQAYAPISLANVPGLKDSPDIVLDRRQHPPSRKQGIGLTIAGSICLAAGAALLAYGIQQRQQRDPRYTDYGSLFAITGGALLGIVGLSLTIPGIVFLVSY